MNMRTIDPNTPADLRPTATELAQLKPGLFVKLWLGSGEHLWAMLVSGRQPDGSFRARLEDTPATSPGYKRGDCLTIRKEHVVEVV